MMEEKELVAYAIEHIKSVFLGLSSRPVPPFHKGIKVNLSRVIGALIEHVESILLFLVSVQVFAVGELDATSFSLHCSLVLN